jgi:hypothetical protein
MTISHGIRVTLSITDDRDLLYVSLRWDGLRWNDVHIPVFMKIFTDVQAKLRSGLGNSRAMMSVLLAGRVYKRCREMGSGAMICTSVSTKMV